MGTAYAPRVDCEHICCSRVMEESRDWRREEKLDLRFNLLEKEGDHLNTQQKLIVKAMIKFFVAAVVALGFITTGYGAECTTENINIGTVRSGRVIRGQPEWEVTVINNCKCAQEAVVLSCDGFETVENLDPNIVSKQADGCLVAKGNPLRPFTSVSFSYAWYPPFVFMPRNSTVLCRVE